MITDTYKKPRFVDRILEEEAEAIKKLQLEVVEDWGLEDHTGNLKKMLREHFSVAQIGDGCQLTMTYVKYFRFLDMPWVSLRRKGLHLYNRIVFGRIYNNTYMRIRLAYQSGLSEDLIGAIKETMDKLNIRE